MVDSPRPYKGPERRRSFWKGFFYPLPERRLDRYFLRSLKQRIAVTAIIVMVASIALFVTVDKTYYYLEHGRQQKDSAHIAFQVNTFIIQYFKEAITYLASSEQFISTLKGEKPPDNPHVVEELNLAKGILGASIVYILDSTGTVVGCSTYDGGKTLTGNNYKFRPYFVQAMEGFASQYPALGVTTGERGLYFSWPIRIETGQPPLGVTVIKVPVTAIDSFLKSKINLYESMLLSPDGIVFCATQSEWLFHAAVNLPKERRETILQSRQFSDQQLAPLQFTVDENMVEVKGGRHIVEKQSLELEGWQIVTLNHFPFPWGVFTLLTCVLIAIGGVSLLAYMFVSKDELLTKELQRGREKRRKIEASRKMTLRELETILAASLVGIVLVKDGFITSVNEKMCSILGYTAEEMVGSDIRWYFPDKKTFRRFVQQYARQLALRDLENIEYMLRSKEGVAIPCSLSGRAIDTDDLTQGVVWVVEDIRDRKKVEKELQRAKNEAESASKIKSEFLANMSHEIRTPLNGIIGLTEFLLEKDHDQDMQNKLELVLSSGKRLMRIINDILEFSKNEVANIEIEQAPFSLYGTLNEVVKNFEVQAREKDLVIELDFDKELPQVLIGDDFRIMQVLFNLVGNGIKFTKKGGVKIQVKKQRATGRDRVMVLFEVSDTGIGIDSELQDQIFDAFTQAESNHSRRYGGTGLGLPISRRIVQQLGGNIHVDSRKGEGARFWFILPFATPEVYAKEQKGSDSVLTDNEIEQATAGYILLADDDFINTTLAVSLLEQVGYTVKTVNDGQAVIDAWAQEEFDCILMDIQMPRMDGHEATRRIRELEKTKGGHIPIIAMTACGGKKDIDEYFLVGMDAYLAKPINRVELFALLKKYCGDGQVEEDLTRGKSHDG